ncbi:MAG: folylpolyglutamate synthase/dihydrofolate synthase family protein [Verrucomicrobiota bacterium]
MTYAEAIQFLYDLQLFGARFGLEKTRRLAELCGNPQEKLRFIHVAGTNGKGSVCAMLESIYRHAGLRVGLYTSPHLVAFGERIQVNRRLIPEGDIIRLVEQMRGHLTAFLQEDHPTFFEVVTVMALQYFAEQNCELVIWETGLGGRLDATNIVTPLASVITNIGLDHQQWLGETIAKIAAEKAGIIKPGVPVITAAEDPEAWPIIKARARELKSPFFRLSSIPDVPPGRKRPTGSEWEDDVVHVYPFFGFGPGGMPEQPPRLSLAGEHQMMNAALAVSVVQTLQQEIRVSIDTVCEGLENVHWPGRLQRIERGGQTILLDGAHNPEAAAALRTALREFEEDPSRVTLILGMMRDKDCEKVCRTLATTAKRILLVPTNSERSAAPADLAGFCRNAHPNADTRVCDSLADALRQSEGTPWVVITGSLYLVGEALEALGTSSAPTVDERALNDWTRR